MLDPVGVLRELRDVDVALPEDALLPADAVALALVHNPDLQAARRDAEIAAGLVVSGTAWENPELRVSLDRLYSRIGDPFSWAVDLRLFPPLPGEVDAQRARLLAAERRVLAEIEAEEARVAREVRVAHARLVLLDTEIAIVRAAAALHGRVAAIVEQQVAAGVATRLEATLVRLRREELSDEAQSLAADREGEQTRLASLLGAPPDAAISVRAAPRGGSSLSVGETALDETALEEAAISRRPDLRALAAAYGEREETLHLAHLARVPWPRHLQAGTGGFPADTTLDLDLAIELPVGGSADAAIAVATSRRDRARAAYRARLHAVRREIRLAVLDVRNRERRRRHREEVLGPILREAENLVGVALQAGAEDLLTVVAIETRALAARRAAARAAFDHELAIVALAAATGGMQE